MPKVIEKWEELDGLETEKYKIVVDLRLYSGWVRTKIGDEGIEYLSTHTFYEKFYEYYTKRLQELGFDVELKSWG